MVQNLHNLKLKAESLGKEMSDLIDYISELKDEAERPITFDDLKRKSIERLVYLGQKMKNRDISPEERAEWDAIGQWLEAVTPPADTKEGRDKKDVETAEYSRRGN